MRLKWDRYHSSVLHSRLSTKAYRAIGAEIALVGKNYAPLWCHWRKSLEENLRKLPPLLIETLVVTLGFLSSTEKFSFRYFYCARTQLQPDRPCAPHLIKNSRFSFAPARVKNEFSLIFPSTFAISHSLSVGDCWRWWLGEKEKRKKFAKLLIRITQFSQSFRRRSAAVEKSSTSGAFSDSKLNRGIAEITSRRRDGRKNVRSLHGEVSLGCSGECAQTRRLLPVKPIVNITKRRNFVIFGWPLSGVKVVLVRYREIFSSRWITHAGERSWLRVAFNSTSSQKTSAGDCVRRAIVAHWGVEFRGRRNRAGEARRCHWFPHALCPAIHLRTAVSHVRCFVVVSNHHRSFFVYILRWVSKCHRDKDQSVAISCQMVSRWVFPPLAANPDRYWGELYARTKQPFMAIGAHWIDDATHEGEIASEALTQRMIYFRLTLFHRNCIHKSESSPL